MVPVGPGGPAGAGLGGVADPGAAVAHPVSTATSAEQAVFYLASIVSSSDDAIVGKDLSGIIQSWNAGAERLFGYRAAEVIGRPITILVPPERLQEEEDILARIARGERVEHYETVRVQKDGTRVDVSLTLSPVKDAEGRVIGASKIARDISQRKREERERHDLLVREQQARAEADAANRAKDEFLAVVSHELRTPLNAIVGWAQVLAHSTDPVTSRRAVETILRNARLQAQLIEDLLDLSSIVSGRVRLNARPVDLAAVLAAAVDSARPAAEAKQIEIEVSIQQGVDPVWGDPDRLQQVFWNLLSNATKFTPKHGRIRVGLEVRGSRAVVAVADTGIGIAPAVLPVIFDRFRQADSSITRAHGGLGLGLAIARQLVELHGGTVEAQSPGEGLGATFTVSLPIRPVRAADRRTPGPPSGAVRCDGIRVLVVEDEPDGRELVSLVLQEAGAEVTAVASAAEALAAIDASPPDVLISDVAMPAMDGYDLIRRVRQVPGSVALPAFALTAHASADARIKAFSAGFDGYIVKPVDAVELTAVVARHGRRMRGPGRP